jgi:hypothetical protein
LSRMALAITDRTVSRASVKRLLRGRGQLSGGRNGRTMRSLSSCRRNVMASPTWAASRSMSSPSMVSDTTRRVRCIIERATSTVPLYFVDSSHSRGGLGELDHARAERPDARAMKRRLRDAALSQPEVAFAGEQAVAEQEAQGVEAGRGLRDILGVVDEQRAHVLGVKQDVPFVPRKRDARDVAALAQAEGQRGERRGAHRVEVLEYRNGPRKLWRAHRVELLPHRVRHSRPCIHFFKSGVIASRTIAGPMELTTRKP